MKLFLLLIVLALVSCVRFIPPVLPNNPDNPNDKASLSINDLKIRSISISPMCNEFIYDSISFTSEDGIKWVGNITNYKADLRSIVLHFDVVADSVLIGSIRQINGVTSNNLENTVVYKLYAGSEYKEFSLSISNPKESYTGRPILAIITNNQVDITSRDEWVVGRIVIDPQEGSCKAYSGTMQIKGRGHNSWSKDKKPYNIKLDSKSSLLGMKKHKRWCLLANASDRTLLRNRVAYELGQRTDLAWTPHCQFIEVLLNGKFVGSYLLTEQIRVDGDRVNITEPFDGANPNQVGYLLEIDRYYDNVKKFRTSFRDLPVNIKEPDADALTYDQLSYISNYLNSIETALYGENTVNESYKDLIDIDSFIDWWIIVELTHNRDTRLPGSCHCYKNANGKLFAGPLWDFDISTFIDDNGSFMLYDYEVDITNPQETNRSLWFKKLFEDPSFVARTKEIWNVRKAAFANIGDFIDSEATLLKDQAETNWSIWTINSGFNRDESLSWEESVSCLKSNLNDRIIWLDNQISSW